MEARQWKIAAEAMDAEEAILRENGMNIHPSISEELAAKLKESGRYIINDWLKKPEQTARRSSMNSKNNVNRCKRYDDAS